MGFFKSKPPGTTDEFLRSSPLPRRSPVGGDEGPEGSSGGESRGRAWHGVGLLEEETFASFAAVGFLENLLKHRTRHERHRLASLAKRPGVIDGTNVDIY